MANATETQAGSLDPDLSQNGYGLQTARRGIGDRLSSASEHCKKTGCSVIQLAIRLTVS